MPGRLVRLYDENPVTQGSGCCAETDETLSPQDVVDQIRQQGFCRVSSLLVSAFREKYFAPRCSSIFGVASS